MPSSLEYIRNGKLRALAVTTATRSPALPDIPTIGEFFARQRIEYLARRWLAQKHPNRNHRQAQQGDQCEPRGSRLKDQACRTRHYSDWGVAGRVGEAHRRGNRKVGQSD